MKISIQDGSNYFRGLLLLVRMDEKVSEPEIDHMRRIGKSLGFEREFVDTCIEEILENTYVATQPPKFSAREIAEKFIADGLAVASSDQDIHPQEEKWLYEVMETNGIDPKWFHKKKQDIIYDEGRNGRLEVDDMTME